MKHRTIYHRTCPDADSGLQSLIAGLLAPHAAIPPKYFYDELGCALYLAICQLPEYYVTRTETTIFNDNRAEIAETAGTNKQLIDLGAGDCRKAAGWFPFLEPSRYIAVDVAEEHLNQSLERLSSEFPNTEMVGIVTDFSDSMNLDNDVGTEPTTFFYPGSSIGNFAPASALQMLRRIRLYCHRPTSGLLIGVDTKKNPSRLEAAYADSLGVTASFNLNVLNHVNRLIGSDFDIAKFRHIALYNESLGRVEMHLEATVNCLVHIGDDSRHFLAGERIHTENSYKYAPAEFESLLLEAGFSSVSCWQDRAKDFSVFYAE